MGSPLGNGSVNTVVRKAVSNTLTGLKRWSCSRRDLPGSQDPSVVNQIDQIKVSRKSRPFTSMTSTIPVIILVVPVSVLFDLSFQYSRAHYQTRNYGRPQQLGFYIVKIALSMEDGGMISIS